jgi:hypothetical protein
VLKFTFSLPAGRERMFLFFGGQRMLCRSFRINIFYVVIIACENSDETEGFLLKLKILLA